MVTGLRGLCVVWKSVNLARKNVLEVLLHICTTPTHLHTQRQTPHPHKTPKAFVSPEENLVV
jgi:hypothetical protein